MSIRNDVLVSISRVGSWQHHEKDARQAAVAQATALVYIGDELARLADATAFAAGGLTVAEWRARNGLPLGEGFGVVEREDDQP